MMRIIAFTLFLTYNLLAFIHAKCPNNCNMQGECDKYSRCSCADGYQGADCSEKICPFGLAWADRATATDVAHNLAECSNRGLCDRETGSCDCMPGFTGSACDRLACSSRCNDRGICFSLQDFADKRRDIYSKRYEYNDIWDAKKIQGCDCDFPATGYDCSQTMCPSGDDPLTPDQVNEIQLVKCTANQGSFTLFYNGLPSLTIPANANANIVKKALMHIAYISDVKVTFSMPLGTACQLKANLIVIEFTQLFGSLSPLVAVGDKVMEASGGYVSVNADGMTTWRDTQGRAYRSRKGTKESDVCSNRGSCDENTGICSCYDSNGDVYGSSNGYAYPGNRGDCGYIVSASTKNVSTCPGLVPCSGHGVCDADTFRCYCQFPFTSGDCSQSACPMGKSWFAYPIADQTNHLQYSVCANMGLCDMNTGKCECREGFYGEACEYMSCPMGSNLKLSPTTYTNGQNAFCSGHGRCMSMAELALWSNSNGDATDFTYGTDPNNVNTWDSDRIHGCLCDEGYSGYDCSLKLCPIGDDPGTYDDHSEVQLIQCIATSGNFTLSFRQKETVILPYNILANDLEMVLNSLSTIKKISVFYLYDGQPPADVFNYIPPEKTNPDGMPWWGMFIDGEFTVVHYNQSVRRDNSTFCSEDGSQIAIVHFTHTHGNVPSIIPNIAYLQDAVNSNGELGSGQINVFADGASVQSLLSIAGTTETDLCNNRGVCDFSSGICQCFEDWTSSDGSRQGGPGYTNDCGYRNDMKFTSFNSIKP